MSTQLLPIVVHEVTGCIDCPMRADHDGFPACKNPQVPAWEIQDCSLDGSAPQDCPLRKAHLLVELKR